MSFPPFPIPKINGLGIYPKVPIIVDQSDRGELQGRRVDAITYICQRPGRFIVPATQLTWWNTNEQALHTIKIPEQIFEVAANPEFVSLQVQKTMSGIPSVKWILVLLLSALAFAFSLYRIPRNRFSKTFNFLRPVHLQPLNPISKIP